YATRFRSARSEIPAYRHGLSKSLQRTLLLGFRPDSACEGRERAARLRADWAPPCRLHGIPRNGFPRALARARHPASSLLRPAQWRENRDWRQGQPETLSPSGSSPSDQISVSPFSNRWAIVLFRISLEPSAILTMRRYCQASARPTSLVRPMAPWA